MHTNTLIRSMCLLCLAAVWALAGGSTAQADESQDSENAAWAREALEITMENLSKVDSLAFDIALHLDSVMTDRETVNDMTARVELRGEDEAFLRAESGGDRVEVYSDGETQAVYFIRRNQYAELPAPESRAEIIGAVSGGLMRQGSLWLGRFLHSDETVLSDATGMEDLGDAGIDNEPFRHIRIAYEHFDAEVYLQPDVPRLRRMVLDLDRGIKTMNPPPGVVGAKVTFDFRNWVTNEMMPEDRFAFVAPDGVTKWDPNARPGVPGMEMLGKDAPNIELALLDGGSFNLADYKDDSVVLLDFFATWCGPCRMGLPAVSDLAKAYAGKDVAFYAVNIKESDKKARKFMTDLKVELPVVMDSKGEAQRLYQASSIPRTVIIGKDGTVQAIHAGFSPYMKKQITEDLDALLEGKTLAEPA